MKLFYTLMIFTISFSSFSKSCFDKKYKKKYEKCLKANIFGNQKKCLKNKKKWEKKCEKEEATKAANAKLKALYKGVESDIKAGKIANQSLEVWKDGKPLGWNVQGKVSLSKSGGYHGSQAAIISGRGSLVQTRRISSRKWHGLYIRSMFKKNMAKANNGLNMQVTIKKNGMIQKIYESSLKYPVVKIWEMTSLELKPELFESEITVAINWDLPSGVTATIDEIRLVAIKDLDKEKLSYRSYLTKEALK